MDLDNLIMEKKLASISLRMNNSDESTDITNEESSRTASTGSESGVDSQLRQKFMDLITKARRLAEDGEIAKAILLNEKALEIHYSDKLKKRIEKMKAFLASQNESDGDDENEGGMKNLGQGFMLHLKLHDNLYRHQKEGVLWMWSLYLLGKGGILADDMGLGKTIQVIAFLAGMFDMKKISSVMIVVPLSVMANWLTEFNKWTPGIDVLQFHGGSKKEREKSLARVRTRGGVLLTTYGLVMTTKETFAVRHGQEFVWDYVILDEGHKIKNPTKTSKSVHLIPARHRIILTGTPVQNNLKELWSLFDYVHQGSLLGTVRTFKMEFEAPIIRARERDASAVEKKLGQEMADTLKNIIKPYFLRRTKAEVQKLKNSGKDDTQDLVMPSMTRKNDLVIWLHLTQTQQKIYHDFINQDSVKELLMTKKSPLVALTVLKKICDHPRLLSQRACLQLGLDGDDFNEEDLEQPEAYESAVSQINQIPDEVLVNESGKMQILVDLLDTFKQEGRKTLVFSQSRKLLNIIQKVIKNRGHKVLRLDGTIAHVKERDDIVQKFQRDPAYSVFLLTIQVGGVGLTITAADRVVIYDPNWNPATDAQAVDRVYRIGQQKNVVVYRLITCGTVEEKIYRRQVFKDSITRQTTGDSNNPYRYFTKMELKELFTLDDPRFSKTQKQLEELHANQRQTDQALDSHIAYLYSLDIFGISDHDLMYRQTETRDDEEEPEDEGEDLQAFNEQFIQHKIQKAQTLIAQESNIPVSYDERNKGMIKYPPTMSTGNTVKAPKPSNLFTQVSSGLDQERPIELDDSIDEGESDESVTEMVHMSDQTHEQMSSPAASPLNSNNQSLVKSERKVLQPLTAEEVRQRSPVVNVSRSEIFTEEILISPDGRCPVIGFEKLNSIHKRQEEAMQTGSFPSSPVRISSPKAHDKSGMSPALSNNPSKQSPHPTSSRNPNLRRSYFSLFGLTSTPNRQDPGSEARLAENTPSIGFSSSHNESDLRRKLDFLSESLALSPGGAGDVRSPMKEKENMQISNIVVPDSDSSSLHDDSLQSQSSQHDVIGSFGGSSAPSPANNKEEVSRRRSVCLQRPALEVSSDESVVGESEAESEEGAEAEGKDLDEDDEIDKENDPIIMRRAGGRNIIVSDAESASSFEVEISDEEGVEEQETHDTDAEDSEAANGRFQDLVKVARTLYKNKLYSESLRYVEEALTIFNEPELVAMGERIKAKLSETQSNP